MRILHITTWYPNLDNPKEALWIKRHIDSLEPFVKEQFILHFEIKLSKKFSLVKGTIKNGKQRILNLPVRSWLFVELLSGISLVYYLLKLKVNNFGMVNFHIAYPTLVYWHLIKRWVKVPVLITEHWSAYHSNFGVEKKLPRIQRIFRQKIPVITISQVLKENISRFAESDFASYVVPNVVDDRFFYPDHNIQRQPFFFMVSLWKKPKHPIIVFRAFEKFISTHPSFILKVGGYGPEYSKMKKWVEQHGMEKSIIFLDSLDTEAIAIELRKCTAFLHCSEYETFSVVCAEAVSCNTPVIASKVGGIPEVIRNEEGVLMESKDPSDWSRAMHDVIKKKFHFGETRFTKKKIGELYRSVLLEVVNGVNG